MNWAWGKRSCRLFGGGAGSDNTREVPVGASSFLFSLIRAKPESFSRPCVRIPSLSHKLGKASSAKGSSSTQSSSSSSSVFVEQESTATDSADTPNKIVKSSSTHENPIPSRIVHKGSSSYATNRKGHQ